MKKRILSLLAVAMMLAMVTRAQTTIKPHVGVNFSNVNITSNEVSGKAGALAGLSVAFGKKFYFEPGLQYVAKSMEIVSTGGSVPNLTPGDFNLRGLRVPMTVGINFLGSQKSTLTFHGFGGLSAFFIMSDNTPSSIELNNTQWGVYAGAGVDIWKIFVDVSYEWSLSKLSTNLQNVEVGGTRSLFVNAGFRFNL